MKSSKVWYSFMGSVALIAVINVAVILNVDTDFNLQLAGVEALADLEDEEDSTENGLITGLCADGMEEFTACVWGAEGDSCTLWDDTDCSMGETPDVLPGDMTEYSECVKYGHFWSSTFCFATCHRCGISTNLCDD